MISRRRMNMEKVRQRVVELVCLCVALVCPAQLCAVHVHLMWGHMITWLHSDIITCYII